MEMRGLRGVLKRHRVSTRCSGARRDFSRSRYNYVMSEQMPNRAPTSGATLDPPGKVQYFGSPLGICLITSCLAAVVGAWYFVTEQPQNGHIGPNPFPATLMVVISAMGPLLAKRRFVSVLILVPPLTVIGCLIGVTDELLEGYLAFEPRYIIGLLGFGLVFTAFYHAVVFAFITPRKQWAIWGAISGMTGLLILTGIAGVVSELSPCRLVVVERPLFIALIAFGPVMGLATGIPAMILLAREQRKKTDLSLCQSCGYDLRGSADSESCPECGTAIPRAKWGPQQ
jgi:predicted RNA-binding Zn-ribbon protein involved in translation (DUF1610 family)